LEYSNDKLFGSPVSEQAPVHLSRFHNIAPFFVDKQPVSPISPSTTSVHPTLANHNLAWAAAKHSFVAVQK
jgi:hypothetical protein